MSGETTIEWATHTWNPTTGCDRVSPGCDHCYALTMAKRLKGIGSAHYQRDGDPKTSGPGFGLSVHPDSLDWPLRKTKPMRVFVNSMSDLFHADVPDEFIARVWAVMALAPRHTFQILTKRPGRMRSLLTSTPFESAVRWEVNDLLDTGVRYPTGWDPEAHDLVWPLPNVWLGVSVEDQKRADLRIPPLLGTPAAVRFLSCEPLLGPVDLCNCYPSGFTSDTYEGVQEHCWLHGQNALDWVIVGGESGPGARLMDAQWARDLRDMCSHPLAPAAFHFKQWGSHDEHGTPMHKKAAGRLLDGRTWDEFPEAVTA